MEKLEPSIFCLLDDKKRAIGLKTLYSYSEKMFKQMNEEGWGVYFAVNDFEATQEQMDKHGVKTKRNVQFLKKLNYVFADLDIAKAGEDVSREIKEQRKDILIKALNDMLPPTRIIKTSNGVQPLWKIDELETDSETQFKYVNTINGIIEWSKLFEALGDAVKDVTRILRLPGYYHMKEEPFMCDEIVNPEEPTYSLQEVSDVFESYCPKETKREKFVPSSYNSAVDEVSREIDRLDVVEVALRAFSSIGRQASFDRQDRLILDGRLTGTFKSKQGNFIASTSHEPFTGNMVTVVSDILACSYKESRKWLMKEFNINYSNQKVTKLEVKEGEFEDIFKSNPSHIPYTWGTPSLDKEISAIKKHAHIVLVGETNSGKSTMAFDMAAKNAALGFKVLFLSLEMPTEELYKLKAMSYAGITKEEDRFEVWSDKKKALATKRYKELKEMKNLILEGFKTEEDKGVEVDYLLKQMKDRDLDLIFIDNMDLIQDSSAHHTELAKQESVSRKIMNFSKNQSIPTVLLHHYKKPSSQGSRGIDAVRGSAKITHNATDVIKVRRENPDLKENGEPLNDREKARLTVASIKDRRRGELGYSQIYWIQGTFKDDFVDGDNELQQQIDRFNK